MLYFLIILGFLILLIRGYIHYLATAKPQPGDDIYYYEGEETFESILAQLGRIEKHFHKHYDKERSFIMYYKHNAEETGRDYDYYEDYIDPVIRYLSLNTEALFSTSWKLCDPFLKAIVIIFSVLYFIPLLILLSGLIAAGGAPFAIFITGLFIIIGGVIIRILLGLLLSILKASEQRFRRKNIPLGAISKAILAMEGLFAGATGSKRLGAVEEHTGYDLSNSGGGGGLGGFGGGGSFGGGGFGGFGGGGFGGGGSGGSW